MKNTIIFLCLPLLFAAFMLSCQRQEPSPVSPEESLALDKKGGKPGGTSVEYDVVCTDDANGYDYTVVSLLPGTVHESGHVVKWAPGVTKFNRSGNGENTYELGGYTLSGEARISLKMKGGKIVSFLFNIWDEDGKGYKGPSRGINVTPVSPSNDGFAVVVQQDNIEVWSTLRNKRDVIIGFISFGDIVFTPKP